MKHLRKHTAPHKLRVYSKYCGNKKPPFSNFLIRFSNSGAFTFLKLFICVSLDSVLDDPHLLPAFSFENKVG